MKNLINTLLLRIIVGLFIIGIPACKIDPIIDPNNPSLDGIQSNSTKSELQNLASGIESLMRNDVATYIDNVSIIGREYYRFSTSDPRFTSDLLGKGSAVLDNNTFYLTNTWTTRYRVVRTTNILLETIKNTKADISPQEKNAANGFAKTIQAYQLLLNLNLLYNNGIRIDVKDPDNLGPFLSYTASLEQIQGILDDAANELSNGGTNFPFALSFGFVGFDTPSNFRKFNKALAARVAVYRGRFPDALNYLSESFLDLNSNDFEKGVYHVYSTGGTDQLNDIYLPPNSTGNMRVAHNSFVTGTSSTDKRLSKVLKRSSSITSDGLTGDYDVMVYKTNTAPIAIIRNEELILIYAEAKTRTGVLVDAIDAINKIRIANGLTAYAGASTEADLINEVLDQRRYSLFGEGHRWIDLRRYNKLGILPIDRPGDDVWIEFPCPMTEAQ
jgi:hypothetical protein